MVFAKKLGACLITVEVQTHPSSNKIGRSLRKIQNIPLKVATTKWELICISHVFYYLFGGVVSIFLFRVLVAASQKNPILAL
jgi:hypothetical protein